MIEECTYPGLTTSDGGVHYLFFVLLCMAVNIAMNQFFIVISSVLPDLSTAMNVGSLCFLLFILFSGYIVAVENLPDGWLWMYYVNPVSWAFLSLVQNEFKSSAYDGVSAGTSTRLGDVYLKQAGMPTDPAWQWYVHADSGVGWFTGSVLLRYGFIALLVFFAVYFVAATFALQSIRFVSGECLWVCLCA